MDYTFELRTTGENEVAVVEILETGADRPAFREQQRIEEDGLWFGRGFISMATPENMTDIVRTEHNMCDSEVSFEECVRRRALSQDAREIGLYMQNSLGRSERQDEL